MYLFSVVIFNLQDLRDRIEKLKFGLKYKTNYLQPNASFKEHNDYSNNADMNGS